VTVPVRNCHFLSEYLLLVRMLVSGAGVLVRLLAVFMRRSCVFLCFLVVSVLVMVGSLVVVMLGCRVVRGRV
jgi:hypothetical protein